MIINTGLPELSISEMLPVQNSIIMNPPYSRKPTADL